MKRRDLPVVSPDPLPERIGIGLQKIALALRHRAQRDVEPRGLSPLQAQILALLDARGAMRPSALADALAVRKPTVTESLAALERKALIRRAPDPADARAQLVSATARGRRETQATDGASALLATASDALEPAEREAFLGALLKMIHALEERGDVPRSRMCATCTQFRPHAHASASAPHHCALLDAPLSPGDLRIECGEHEAIEDEGERAAVWARFTRRGDASAG